MRKRPLGPKAEEQVLFPSKATAALSGRTGGGKGAPAAGPGPAVVQRTLCLNHAPPRPGATPGPHESGNRRACSEITYWGGT